MLTAMARSENRTSPFRGIIRSLTLARCGVIVARTIVLLISMCVIFALTSTIRTETAEASNEPKSRMALPGKRCRVMPRPQPEWILSEQWTWREICEGRVADFNKYLKEKLDPKNQNHNCKCSDNRTLRSDFLKTILLYEPFRSAIPHRGVIIVGAYFPKHIDLSDAVINQTLALLHSYFDSSVAIERLTTPSSIYFDGSKFTDELSMASVSIGDALFMRKAQFVEVDLRGAKIGDQLTMRGSTFSGQLDMPSISIEGDLFMNGKGTQFAGVLLRGAKIGDQLTMSGSTFSGKLDMGSVSIGDALLMQGGAQFAEVDLRGAKIGDQLTMSGSTFSGQLTMNSVSIGSHLFMNERGTQFAKVDLRGAKIGNALTMVRSTFSGQLDMNSVSIGGDLFMRETKFHKPANLPFLSIGSNLDVRGARLTDLDLTSTTIEREFWLGSSDKKDITWKATIDEDGTVHPPKLTLRNTSVGVLQDTEGTWSDDLKREFDGFTYDYLGGFVADTQDMPHKRGSDWFINWLAKDESYSPQPYRHLARVLRNAGYEGMADDILFENRVRERKESNFREFKWWGLWLLQVTIGYGYGRWMFLALVWAAIFVLFGTLLLSWKEKEKQLGFWYNFWYSLDMFLPIVRLREQHYERNLKGITQTYFCIHKIIGYVIIFFVIAGLTNLTG